MILEKLSGNYEATSEEDDGPPDKYNLVGLIANLGAQFGNAFDTLELI